MSKISEIKDLISKNNTGKAAILADELLSEEPENSEAWYLRGKLWWRSGERGRAMSCYTRAVSIDPNSPAATALEQANAIADFFNPDLLNP